MASAYTAGLTVTANSQIERTRRLPIKGEILVKVGDSVNPKSVVARALLPGIMQSVKVSNVLGIDPEDITPALQVKIGDTVEIGDILAQSKGLFGWFSAEAKSPVAGVVETISNVSGNVGVRQAPIPIDLLAYIDGKVSQLIEGEGVIVATAGALVQGIFGFGGERSGEILVVSESPDQVLTDSQIDSSMAGKILIGGSNLTGSALSKADSIGVAGIIAGALIDKDMIEFLGYDIGVAITGHEKINTTVVVTEGFGTIPMAQRTFDLLKSLNGKHGSINGATQIRAGVIRPELVVPGEAGAVIPVSDETFTLNIGTEIRVIREPYFGELATVSALPPKLTTVDSGAQVRVLEAKLKNGDVVTVPRANVEIVAG